MQSTQYRSRVLDEWAASRSGFAQRVAGSGAPAQIMNAQMITGTSSDAEAMKAIFQPLPSASGFVVTDKTAMHISTVYACLSTKAGAITQLPIHHYRKGAGGLRERVADSPLWWLLNESPSPAWTAASWIEWIVRCIDLRGDQFTRIVRTSNGSGGRITAFEPLHPDYVRPRRLGNRLVYDYLDPYSTKQLTVDQDDMLHFSGFGFDGLSSPSAIQTAARQSIGNALAAGDYMGRTVGEGSMPQIALSFPNVMNKQQSKDLRESFVATYVGTGNRKLPLVLTEGGTATPLTISPVDMELMAMRQFEREDICQAIGVPPVLIGDNSKTSSWGTGIEQITLGFVKFKIKPLLVRIEEELNRKLFAYSGQFVEFELDGLLRGDSKAQAEAFKAALGGPGAGDGYMTVNEVRRLKNLPPDSDPMSDKPFKAQRGAAVTPPAPAANTEE